MALSELPTEVLKTMAKQSGIDTTRVPDEQPQQADAVNSMVARLKKENGNIGELSKLLRQRMNYNKVVKQINDENTASMLKKQADLNRRLLNESFLQRNGQTSNGKRHTTDSGSSKGQRR
jgi:hypothetical protein